MDVTRSDEMMAGEAKDRVDVRADVCGWMIGSWDRFDRGRARRVMAIHLTTPTINLRAAV